MAERGRTWGDDETRALLVAWGEDSIQRELLRSIRNRVAFKRVAADLHAKGFSRTYHQCRDKIKSLKKRYREARDQLRENGAGVASDEDVGVVEVPVDFKWFYDIRSVMEKRPALHPSALLDSSELRTDYQTEGASMSVDTGSSLVRSTSAAGPGLSLASPDLPSHTHILTLSNHPSTSADPPPSALTGAPTATSRPAPLPALSSSPLATSDVPTTLTTNPPPPPLRSVPLSNRPSTSSGRPPPSTRSRPPPTTPDSPSSSSNSTASSPAVNAGCSSKRRKLNKTHRVEQSDQLEGILKSFLASQEEARKQFMALEMRRMEMEEEQRKRDAERDKRFFSFMQQFFTTMLGQPPRPSVSSSTTGAMDPQATRMAQESQDVQNRPDDEET